MDATYQSSNILLCIVHQMNSRWLHSLSALRFLLSPVFPRLSVLVVLMLQLLAVNTSLPGNPDFQVFH